MNDDVDTDLLTLHRREKQDNPPQAQEKLTDKAGQLQTEPDYDQILQTANTSPKNAPQRTTAMQDGVKHLHSISALWNPPCPSTQPAPPQHSSGGKTLSEGLSGQIWYYTVNAHRKT